MVGREPRALFAAGSDLKDFVALAPAKIADGVESYHGRNALATKRISKQKHRTLGAIHPARSIKSFPGCDAHT